MPRCTMEIWRAEVGRGVGWAAALTSSCSALQRGEDWKGKDHVKYSCSCSLALVFSIVF